MTTKNQRKVNKKISNIKLMNENEFNRDEFPKLRNLSSAFFFNKLPIPRERKRPEFVFLKGTTNSQQLRPEVEVTVADWNTVWEIGHLRPEFFWHRLPKELEWLRNYEGENIYLIPDEKASPHQTFAPLLHLLPLHTRKLFNLPLLARGNWPFTTDLESYSIRQNVKQSLTKNLSKAFAHHIWQLLDKQCNIYSYSNKDPLSLIAHNLKFWLPPMYSILEEAAMEFGRVSPNSQSQIEDIAKTQMDYPDLDIRLPLKGGHFWIGEDEAWSFTKKLIEKADSEGHLRSLIDAIRSHRVQDDFSERWSYAKADFERKLYSKRRKIKVNFVELDDRIPIHSPSSEIDDNYLWDDLMTFLDGKENRIIVCLRKGVTNHKEISEILGYKNHSPVTKALRKIRKIAAEKLDISPRNKML